MKILHKIIAFFNFRGEPQEMELSGAEIRNRGVFLHPIDDPKHVFFVKSNSVDIIINHNEEIEENDISVVDKEIIDNKTTTEKEPINPGGTEKETILRPLSYSKFMPSKKRFSVMLYQDEYDLLMDNIVNKGYKKAEYFLACVNAAKKQSFEVVYKKYTDEHKKRYKSDLIEAKKTQREIANQLQASSLQQ